MNATVTALDLRPGAARDLDAVDRVMRAAFDPRYGEAWTRPQCLGILSMAGVWLTLAERAGEPVGFALARAIQDEAELLLLAVVPSQRRRGVGAAILRSVIADAGVRGVRQLHLEMRAGNDAVHLYRAYGFVEVGQRRAYYRGHTGQAFDALTLKRAL